MNIYFSRRPVFDTARGTVGYELLYRPVAGVENADEKEDENLFRQNYPIFFKDKLAFIRFTPELIEHNIPWRLPGTGLFLEVDAEMLTCRETLEKCFQLKRGGFTIMLGNFLYDPKHEELFRFANVIRFSADSDKEKIRKTVERCAAAEKAVFISNVNTAAQYEYACEVGCDYIEGDFYKNPIAEAKQSGGPMIRTFLQILAMVYGPEPNLDHIAALISTDPVLTIRLLRQINTVFEGKYNAVSTVQQALVILGIDKLKQWVYLVGLQRLNRDAPAELLKLALFRASFCERVARLMPGHAVKPGEMYLMGLISIVTGSSAFGENAENASEALERTLSGLPVTEDIRRGLLGEAGSYGDVLRLVYAYENADFDHVERAVAALGIDGCALAAQYVTSVKFANGFTRLG